MCDINYLLTSIECQINNIDTLVEYYRKMINIGTAFIQEIVNTLLISYNYS